MSDATMSMERLPLEVTQPSILVRMSSQTISLETALVAVSAVCCEVLLMVLAVANAKRTTHVPLDHLVHQAPQVKTVMTVNLAKRVQAVETLKTSCLQLATLTPASTVPMVPWVLPVQRDAQDHVEWLVQTVAQACLVVTGSQAALARWDRLERWDMMGRLV